MQYSANASSWKRRGILTAIFLVAVLTQASWLMYSTFTAFESAIDHGQSSPPSPILGIVAAGELIAVLLIFAQRRPDDADEDRTPLDAALGPPAGRGGRARKFDVFLSYSRRQFYFAESLMLRLERKSVSVWFDTSRIQAGDDWKESIDQGLSTCTSLVLVASRDALASKNVDLEWRTALKNDKKIYVVFFEVVQLPPELSRAAVAIIDMRTGFEPRARKLAELLANPGSGHRDRAPAKSLRRFSPRQPPTTLLITITLMLILATSVFFDILNVRTLVAITTPHQKNIPDGADISFTTHLIGFTFHGLSSKVYAFLGIAVVTLLLTAMTAFLLVAIRYRRRFILTLLPLALLGSSWLYLNTSFINHSTNHIIEDISGRLMSTPANLNSSAWRDLGDMLLGRYVAYGSSSSFDYGSPFLSVGDVGPYLATTSAHWRGPTLLLLALATIALLTAQRSGALFRRLATGSASEQLRFQHNRPQGQPKGPGTSRSGAYREQKSRWIAPVRPPQWRLLYEPEDSHIAAEIETVLARRVRGDGGSTQRRDVAIVLLTNHTRQASLEHLERDNPDLICVVCTNIRPVETLKVLRRHQWFDYRQRSYDKLILLARSLQKSPTASTGYSFPALPERLTNLVVPGSVRYRSHAMRLCAIWLLAVNLFGGGRIYSSFAQDEGAGAIFPVLAKLMFWICIPCCLYLFWLAVELAACRTTYQRFLRRRRTVMIVLFVTQLQFLLGFNDQLSITLLGTLINVFLAIAWFTPDAGRLHRWLPADQNQITRTVGTLAVPLWQQFARSSMIYLALFVLCYLSALLFFADAA
jgi:hypothetical protein